MHRYQKPPDKPGGGKKQQFSRIQALRASLEKWQAKLDKSVRHYDKRDYAAAEQLFVPEELQTRDPSLMSEIKSGHFGLDRMFIEVGEGFPSVFVNPDADDSFNRLLHGFGWLRDLRARDDFEAQLEAQNLVFEWMQDHWRAEGVAYEPQVIARRITSLLSNSTFVLRGVRKNRTRRYMQTLSQQIIELRERLDETPEGLPRLLVLGTLVMAGLCLSKHDELLEEMTPMLFKEFDSQVFKDGGHYSRNPAAILDILFQILPLKQCYVGRGKEVPVELRRVIRRMLPMIRFFRLGDSSLVRFNGTSTTPTDALATLLAHDERNRAFDAYAKDSAYCRVQDGPATLVCDVGTAPPLEVSGLAHAGCLSFELSIRHIAVVVNSGAYQGEDERWQRYARSTMAHSTLTIDDFSSGAFGDRGSLAGPVRIEVERADLSGLEVSHYGYEEEFGYVHRRSLVLSREGLLLKGIDSLEGVGHTRNEPYCIRFHLHPLIELSQSNEDNLLLTLPDGEIWRFTAKGAAIGMEDSIYLAYRRGPQPAHQITLTGTAYPGIQVDWLFEQYRERPPLDI